MPRSPEEQLTQFKALLTETKLRKDSASFLTCVEWVKNFPSSLQEDQRVEVRKLICSCFDISTEELDHEIFVAATPFLTLEKERDLEQELWGMLPKKGFLSRYANYTLNCEPPLAYHVFNALTAVGAVVNRRVFFNMGYYKVYPNMGILILGPSGVKKTSASNITIDLLNTLGIVKVYSEKLTPEALVEAMKTENATGLIYAPEMSVFLNRQKYNEGLVPLITRFMDCPDFWESGTIMRGKSKLHNIAISSIMCSTSDWFITNIPADAFTGGFIPRQIMVIQQSSSRCEPIPRPGDPKDRERLMLELSYLHQLEGEIIFDKQADKMHDDWYRGEHQREMASPEYELLAAYHNRKPDHLKRVAICLHLTDCGSLTLCVTCMERALNMLNWTEQFVPPMLEKMFRTQTGEEQEFIMRIINSFGRITHATLVRRAGYRLNSQQTRGVVSSLKEQKRVREFNTNLGHYYEAVREGE